MGSLYVGKEDLEYMRESMKNKCNHQHLRRIGNEHFVIFKCKDCGNIVSDYADNIRHSPQVEEK